MTLIDTPGLGSANEGTSARTMASLLDAGIEGPADADAVLYLVRHLHHGDARFLEAFMDHSIAHASPVNAVVVLSRADEIGAARADALVSAATIAARYATDPRVRELASGVLPVAGLLAETGATLRQDQFEWIRQLASLEPDASDCCGRSSGSAIPSCARWARTSGRSSSIGSAYTGSASRRR
jgi:hypothetical protein